MLLFQADVARDLFRSHGRLSLSGQTLVLMLVLVLVLVRTLVLVLALRWR